MLVKVACAFTRAKLEADHSKDSDHVVSVQLYCLGVTRLWKFAWLLTAGCGRSLATIKDLEKHTRLHTELKLHMQIPSPLDACRSLRSSG